MYYLLLYYISAVATHKYVISFCMGLELFNANTPKALYTTYVLVFSLMSMIGIGIGTSLTSGIVDNSVSYVVMIGILQASITLFRNKPSKSFDVHFYSHYQFLSLFAHVNFRLLQEEQSYMSPYLKYWTEKRTRKTFPDPYSSYALS